MWIKKLEMVGDVNEQLTVARVIERTVVLVCTEM